VWQNALAFDFSWIDTGIMQFRQTSDCCSRDATRTTAVAPTTNATPTITAATITITTTATGRTQQKQQ
jgi:hypothetical protein